ncbi:glycoside hydrolase family 71 [Burkholderia sp. A9]|uniref:glycoside hydrolase family 71 protein n=1 Tax=Burkholderia sp. A9 TaxID=1365108 RepID=UPI000574DE1E|nr:glycoside hydrolase family 71 protein [Burkholderia sp. A9]KHK57091.1 glycoside hydrolase family 71 [Burkholderia sp. A9]
MKRRSFIKASVVAGLGIPASCHAVPFSAVSEAVGRRVFAHYMLAWPRGGKDATIDQYESEIRDALSAGIDGFALNCGGWNASEPYYKARALTIYAAAERFDGRFKLFVSADGKAQDELEDIVSTVRELRAQWKIDGRPVVSSYALGGKYGERCRSMIETARALGVYFIPHFVPSTGEREISANEAAEIVRRLGPAEGFFYFGAAGDPALIDRSTRTLAAALGVSGKRFMAPVTPYYRGRPEGTNYRAFESHGFAGMAREWRAAIESNATWVQIVTWNDWAESTYVAPVGAARTEVVYDKRFGPILNHEGYLQASRYFIEWFKSGTRPAIVRDEIFFFYRLHPTPVNYPGISFVASNVLAAPKMPQERLIDRIFVTVFLTRPAMLAIRQTDSIERRPLRAGISFVDVGSVVGVPVFSIERDGRSVVNAAGELAITRDDFSSRYNYYSGWASGDLQ